MARKLAKLEELKQTDLLNVTGTDHDARLTTLLEVASSMAESTHGAARPLRRSTFTEYPWESDFEGAIVRLDNSPIEAVTSVKQLYDTGTDAEFTAATSLTENTDFVVDSALGKLERVNSYWFLKRRHLQVIYVGGYVDPDETVTYPDGILPPEDLQRGVLLQAVKLFRTGGFAGTDSAGGGGAAGSVSVNPKALVPELVAACQGLRRLF